MTAQTGEIILDVVAQFVFRPGSGQPTLLWLDSVHTVRSAQHFGDQTPREKVDPNNEFLQLTRDLEEGKSGRPWTTFFPPKIGDLVSGGVSLGKTEAGLSAESQRSEFLRRRNERSVKTEAGSREESREENGFNAGESGIVPIVVPIVSAKANEATDGMFHPAGGMAEQDGSNGISGVEQVGRVRNNDGPNGGYERGEGFTLPTESWAHRSAGRRGLYFSRTGGRGVDADQTPNERWPRKRSTGTTMRRDCRRDRLDLRSAVENQGRMTRRATSAPEPGCVKAGVRG